MKKMNGRALPLGFLLLFAFAPLAAQSPLYWAIANNDALATWNLTDPGGGDTVSLVPEDLDWAVERGAGEAFDVLTYRGVPLDSVDEKGRNLLFQASLQGRLDLFRKIAGAGVRLDQVDEAGLGILHLGAASGQAAMVPYLLGRGLPPKLRSKLGITPLMAACRAGQPANVKTLLDWGAVPEDEDYLGRTVLWYAQAGGNAEVIGLIEAELSAGLEPSPADAAPLP